MREEDIETAIKVVIVGNGAVGKSSMIQRFCKGIFTKEYKKTIGVDFLERQITVNGEDVRLMLWDTAGQEEFDAITKAYYRGAQACVLTFSTVDRNSFDAIEKWKKKVEAECGYVPSVLVQNKMDLVEQSVVNKEEAEALAKRLKLRLYRTSVKENLHVDEVFRYLSDKYMLLMNSCVDDGQMQRIGGPNVFTTGNGIDNRNGNEKHQTIQLHPNKRRTQGKKSVIGKCSLL
ncbi:PREDICTED: ras-related protein Rab-23-like [Priapulus caudatus]|uniref:Ras-related protein Rab-23-like n=1 Tax=Priapulus caudatus TaxID=37621 RepID=A0ABM1ELM8_PRICU|nr:PREDICTED: ras-related protein Rab-23-like [Priapulus caudatus]XP_014673100.1 PREDICTED: ras-related protein Rab-23-like [Priapulus caudatus]XP_014673101.1 PREDICTED: ras-related protein Rab-23-like [Priapulus caudatus]XP_014673102.1 PREDICTED: ras-related protein Rab-23-like [Priapulus caudatus]XP_014673103.1 PREDICTED: ras-related protein Rab-23-like [Priapulus caudatus]